MFSYNLGEQTPASSNLISDLQRETCCAARLLGLNMIICLEGCLWEIAAVLSQSSLIELLKVKKIITVCNPPFLSDIYKMFFHFALTLYKYQKGENLCTYRPACCMPVLRSTWCRYWIPTPMGLHLTFTVFSLQTPLRSMQDEAYCLSVSLLQAANASAVTIDFLVCLTEMERMSPCIYWLSVPCGFTLYAHTYFFFCVCVCMSLYVCLTTHGFMHICTVFAFVLLGGKQSLLMQDLHWQFKRTQQIVPVLTTVLWMPPLTAS